MSAHGVGSVDRQGIDSFTALLSQLEGRQGQLTPAAEDFLTVHAAKLSECANPFKNSAQSSKAQVDSGKVSSSDGVQLNLGQNEKPLALQVSEKLVIDEVEAVLLLRAYRRSRGEDDAKDVRANLGQDAEFWEGITCFCFDERLAIMLVVAHLLRKAALEEEVPEDILATVGDKILTTAFSKTLLERVAHLATTPIPNSAAPFSAFWARQYVHEQKILLEIYFLLYYNKLFPTGQSLLDILDCIKRTEWGTRQANQGYFDAEAEALQTDVAVLLTLVAVENLNLERAAIPDANDFSILPELASSEDTQPLLSPTTLTSVHQTIIEIGTAFPSQSGPLLLAWSFVLSRITQTLSTMEVLKAYHSIACELLPIDQHPTQSSTSRDAGNQSRQPFYQLLAMHALSPASQALSTLHSILVSRLVLPTASTDAHFHSSAEPSVPGYLSVSRSLIASVPLLIHPSFLPDTEYNALVAVFEALYSNPAAGLLRGHFWSLYEDEEDASTAGEWALLELAQDRFPIQIGGLTKMLRALAGGVPHVHDSHQEVLEEEQLAHRCSEKVLERLLSLSSLTYQTPSSSSVVPLPYEPSSDANAGPLDVVALRPIPVSASVNVPVGTPGRIVSPPEQRPAIVSWDMSSTKRGSFSGWKLFGDLLADYAGRSPRSRKVKRKEGDTDDVFGAGDSAAERAPPKTWETREAQVADITVILETIRVVLSHDPARAVALARELSSDTDADIVQTLFSILEKAMASDVVPDSIVCPVVHILNALLSAFPGMIWTFLRGSTVLFPIAPSTAATGSAGRYAAPNRSVLGHDKSKGVYDTTLAVLDLVRGLFLEAQRSSLVDSAAFAELKNDVLLRALRWCMDSVWMNFSTWRYIDVKHKFQLGARLATLFNQILEEAECVTKLSSKSIEGSVELVASALVTNATSPRLSPLIGFIGAGANLIMGLLRVGKRTESLNAQQCVEACLLLARRSLALSRRLLPSQPTLIERLFFAHSNNKLLSSTVSGPHIDLVAVLLTYITTTFNSRLAISSCHIISTLCRLSVDWGSGSERPSLLGHLGGMRESRDTVDALLAIASDPFVEVEVQIATWEVLTAIVSSQPGLAALVVTGKQALPPVLDRGEETKRDVTALSIAQQVLFGWKEAWDKQPALLSAAMDFLCAVWESLADYRQDMQTIRADKELWQAAVAMSSFSITDLPRVRHLEQPEKAAETEVSIVQYCYRKSAQAGAVRLLSLDIQFEMDNALKREQQPTCASFEAFTKLIEEAKLSPILKAETLDNFKPDIHSESDAALRKTFRDFDLETFSQPMRAAQSGPSFGSDYFYSINLIRNRFEGCHSAEVDDLVIAHAIRRVSVLNNSLSLLSVQTTSMTAWQSLLATALPRIKETERVVSQVWSSLEAVISHTVGESRSGHQVESLYIQRLSMAKTLLEYTTRPSTKIQAKQLVEMLDHTTTVLNSSTLDPLVSLKQQGSGFHRLVYQICYLLLYKIAATFTDISAVPLDQLSIFNSRMEESLNAGLTGVMACISIVQTGNASSELVEDFDLCTSFVQILLSSSVAPRPSFWLPYCQNLDFFRTTFEYISSCGTDEIQSAISRHLLAMCLSLACYPQAAEQMALAGLVSALNNNALTSELEEGRLQAVSSDGTVLAGQPVAHQQWCLMLAIVTHLVTHLGHSVPFMENEIFAFVQLYTKQLLVPLYWSTTDTLTVASLQEMQHVTSLLNAVVSNSSASSPTMSAVLSRLMRDSLVLLQQLVYLLQHPNLLSTLLEPATADEQAWLQSESNATEDISLADLAKRPVAASILQEVFKLCSIILASFVTYSRGFMVLTRDPIDWPRDRVVISASPNVSLEEPANIGTLFDLARFCVDAIRHVKPTSTDSTTAAGRTGPLPTYSANAFSDVAKYTQETTLLFMSTQIALIVQQQDFAAVGGSSKDRSAQRARRDLKELASDLVEEFLEKPQGSSAREGEQEKFVAVIKAFILRS